MTHGNTRAIEFAELDTGCFVCVSHKTGRSGYFLVSLNNRLQSFHRVVWELHNGPIPEEYEIDHTCRNRACCNVAHLRCIHGSEHASHTNVTRSAPRIKAAKDYWVDNGFPKYARVAEAFNVDPVTAWYWVNRWKNGGVAA